MFEVMRQTGVGCRVMLASGARYDFGIEPGFFVVGAKVNGEAVFECALDDLHEEWLLSLEFASFEEEVLVT